MLAIISDLHLTDGSTCDSLDPGAMRQFLHTLATVAESACWRRRPGRDRGVFDPLERIDLLLLGDILDLMRSEYWQPNGVRPWSAPAALAPTITAITQRILQHNDALLAPLRAVGGLLPITASDSGRTHFIPLHVHYLVGNHDWPLHLRGDDWDALRQTVCQAMALSNDPLRPFPHQPAEDPTLAALCRAHRLHAEHGDIHDPVNYQADKGRDHASLGDAIVVEILNQFPRRVREALELPPTHPLARAFHEADNIRPLLALPHYLLAASRQFGTRAEQQKIQQLWTSASQPFLDLPFVHSLDRPWRLDTVDMLQGFFRFQQATPLALQAQLSRFLQRFAQAESYREAALQAARREAVDTVVYGHTHHAELVPLSAEWPDGTLHARRYVNTGTWRRLHAPAMNADGVFPFMHYHVMTHAFFYKDDERYGRRVELWQGSLC
ncbi:MAG: hypothetical protein ACK4UT_04470 [Moraxellaceae bacterium]